MKCFHPIVLIATFIGIPIFVYENFKRKDNLLFVNFTFSIIIYYTILYTVFAPWPRYSVPLRPELYLFALWTFKTLTAYVIEKLEL